MEMNATAIASICAHMPSMVSTNSLSSFGLSRRSCAYVVPIMNSSGPFARRTAPSPSPLTARASSAIGTTTAETTFNAP
jgi:hypothetical protein